MRGFYSVLFFLAIPVYAAPLDGLLTALPETYSDKLTVEAGYDMANDTVDVFNIRGDVASDIGDYAGGHVRVVWPVTKHFQIDGSLWKRGIDYREDTIKLDSWQVGAQHRIANQKGLLPALALRMSAWGSRSDGVTKSGDLSINGFTAESATVHNPKDQQAQLDILSTWSFGDGWQMDLFAGVGRGKVKLDNLTTKTIRGSNSDGSISVEAIKGSVISKQNTFLPEALVTSSGKTASAADVFVSKDRIEMGRLTYTNDRGIDFHFESVRITPSAATHGVEQEDLVAALDGYTLAPSELVTLSNRAVFDFSQVEYDFNYAQAGLALSWHKDNWRMRGSYLWQKFNRDSGVSDAFTAVQTVTGEVAYRIGDGKAVFVRGQLMDRNLMGETPLAYNSLTASRFDKMYGLLTLGLVMGF